CAPSRSERRGPGGPGPIRVAAATLSRGSSTTQPETVAGGGRLKRRARAAIRYVGFVLAVAALVAAHATPLRAADAPRAERPVYHVGDKWPRTDGAWELTRIDKDAYVFSAGGGKRTPPPNDL